MVRTPLVILILFSFLISSVIGPLPGARADEFYLPAPGVMIHLSPDFNPPILKGIKVHPDNPFQFEFILDKGDSELSNDQLKDESSKLIKYFLASLTIPEKDLWVNLSPYEKDRIIPNSFGLTEMGRDLLGEDYILKQITASLIYPEDGVGKRFWKRVYEEAAKRYGTTNIPVNTFNKVWIVPEKAVVFENEDEGAAYVVESKLKVMLEQDYLALSKNSSSNSLPLVGRVREGGKDVNALGSQIVREIVIPELTIEVNENKNFARLRQVYNSLILATWYKNKIKESILSQVYSDKDKVAGVNIDDPKEKDKIYQRYLRAFKKGVYNYIKEDVDPLTQEMIPRKYFSGGVAFAMTTNTGAGRTNLGTIVNILTKKRTPPAVITSILRSFKKSTFLLVLAGLTTSTSFKQASAEKVVFTGSSRIGVQQNILTRKYSLSSESAQKELLKTLANFEGLKKLTSEEILALIHKEKAAAVRPLPKEISDRIMTVLVNQLDAYRSSKEILQEEIDRLVFYVNNSEDPDVSAYAGKLLSALPYYVDQNLKDDMTNYISRASSKAAKDKLEARERELGSKLMISKKFLGALIAGTTPSQDLWSPNERESFKWVSQVLRTHREILNDLYKDPKTGEAIPLTTILDALNDYGTLKQSGFSLIFIQKGGTNKFVISTNNYDPNVNNINFKDLLERAAKGGFEGAFMTLALFSIFMIDPTKKLKIGIKPQTGRPEALTFRAPESLNIFERAQRHMDLLRMSIDEGSRLGSSQTREREIWRKQVIVQMDGADEFINQLDAIGYYQNISQQLREAVDELEVRSGERTNRQLLKMARTINRYKESWTKPSSLWLDLKNREQWAIEAQAESQNADERIKELKRSKNIETNLGMKESYQRGINELQRYKVALDDLWHPIDNDRIDLLLRKKGKKVKSESIIEKQENIDKVQFEYINAKRIANDMIVKTSADTKAFENESFDLFKRELNEVAEKANSNLIQLRGVSFKKWRRGIVEFSNKINAHQANYEERLSQVSKLALIASLKGEKYIRIYNTSLPEILKQEFDILKSNGDLINKTLNEGPIKSFVRLVTESIGIASVSEYFQYAVDEKKLVKDSQFLSKFEPINISTPQVNSAMTNKGISRRDSIIAMAGIFSLLKSGNIAKAAEQLSNMRGPELENRVKNLPGRPSVKISYRDWMRDLLIKATRLKGFYVEQDLKQQRLKQHAGEVLSEQQRIRSILGYLKVIIDTAGLEDSVEIGSSESSFSTLSSTPGRGMYGLANAVKQLKGFRDPNLDGLVEQADKLYGLSSIDKLDLNKNTIVIMPPAAGDPRWRSEYLIKAYQDAGYNVLMYAFNPTLPASEIAKNLYESMSSPFMKEIMLNKGVTFVGFSAARTYMDQTLKDYGDTGLFRKSVVRMASGNWGGSPKADVSRIPLGKVIEKVFVAGEYKNMIYGQDPNGAEQLSLLEHHSEIVSQVAGYYGTLSYGDKHMPNFKDWIKTSSGEKYPATYLLWEAFNGTNDEKSREAYRLLREHYANKILQTNFLQEVNRLQMSFEDIDIKKHKGNPYYETVHVAALLSPEGAARVVEDTNRYYKKQVKAIAQPSLAMVVKKYGGIDLTPANMNLLVRNGGGGIKFHVNPAMLQQLQNAPGFTPVIINIQPLNSLQRFLGISETKELSVTG